MIEAKGLSLLSRLGFCAFIGFVLVLSLAGTLLRWTVLHPSAVCPPIFDSVPNSVQESP